MEFCITPLAFFGLRFLLSDMGIIPAVLYVSGVITAEVQDMGMLYKI